MPHLPCQDVRPKARREIHYPKCLAAVQKRAPANCSLHRDTVASHSVHTSSVSLSPSATSASVNLYPGYTIKQTSSNHRANIQQIHSKYTCTTCVCSNCSMFAWWLYDRVNGVLNTLLQWRKKIIRHVNWGFHLLSPLLLSLSLPFPFPSLSSLHLSIPFARLPPLKKTIKIQPGGLAERCELPQQSPGRSPSRNQIRYIISLKYEMATTAIIFLRINWPNLMQFKLFLRSVWELGRERLNPCSPCYALITQSCHLLIIPKSFHKKLSISERVYIRK